MPRWPLGPGAVFAVTGVVLLGAWTVFLLFDVWRPDAVAAVAPEHAWRHLFDDRPVEWVQWVFLAATAVAGAHLAGALRHTRLHAAGMFLLLFAIGAAVMLLGEAGDIRHALSSYAHAAVGDDVLGVNYRVVSDVPYFAVLAAIPLVAIVRYGRAAWQAPAARPFLVAGYGLYAAVSIASGLRHLGSAYERVGRGMHLLLADGEMTVPAGYTVKEFEFLLVHSVLEEPLELLAATFFLAMVLTLGRDLPGQRADSPGAQGRWTAPSVALRHRPVVLDPSPTRTSGIAVVIPTIGRPELARALDSVTRQTVPPDELIVVDNSGDLDATRRLVAERAPGARVLSLPPRSGPGASRNVGAWHASSRYVAFLDDDDSYAQDYLGSMLAAIGDSAPGVLYGRKVYVDGDGRELRSKPLDAVPREQWLDRLYVHDNIGFGGQNVVSDREALFDLGGFPAHVLSGQDRAFAIAALRSEQTLVYVPDAVVHCHVPEGSRSRGQPDKWRNWLEITRMHWSGMSWPVRIKSMARVTRAFAASVRR